MFDDNIASLENLASPENLAKPSNVEASRHRPRIACPRTLRGWRFSPHARHKVDARWFAPHDVIDACEDPEMTMTAYDFGPGRMRFVREDLIVIAAPDRRQIITVLLRRYDSWSDDDARKVSER